MIGVVIGRFQTPFLHEGHKHVLDVANKNDSLLILVGSKPGNPTVTNPMSFSARESMLRQQYPNATIKEVFDNKSDVIWSIRVDSIIEKYFPDCDVTIYGSRDHSLNCYSGKYKIQIITSGNPEISATEIRKKTATEVVSSQDWRKGIIHSVHNRFPISYQCVDIAIIKNDPPSAFYKQLLVGKKKGEDKWRFIGGFVDVKDRCLEIAAKREVSEECGNIETDNYKYIGSARIDDWRYRGTSDGVMTAFFICDYVFGRVFPTDDINEVQFISTMNLKPENFEAEHHVLVNMLNEYLKKHINLHI